MLLKSQLLRTLAIAWQNWQRFIALLCISMPIFGVAAAPPPNTARAEPPTGTVEVYYVVPANLTPKDRYLDAIRRVMPEIQEWYRQRMSAGSQTFTYSGPTLLRIGAVSQGAPGHLPGLANAVLPAQKPYTIRLFFGQGFGGYAGGNLQNNSMGFVGVGDFVLEPISGIRDNEATHCSFGGESLYCNFSRAFGTILHELGHAFGLHHPPANSPEIYYSLMTVGSIGSTLSSHERRYLEASPFFTRTQSISLPTQTIDEINGGSALTMEYSPPAGAVARFEDHKNIYPLAHSVKGDKVEVVLPADASPGFIYFVNDATGYKTDPLMVNVVGRRPSQVSNVQGYILGGKPHMANISWASDSLDVGGFVIWNADLSSVKFAHLWERDAYIPVNSNSCFYVAQFSKNRTGSLQSDPVCLNGGSLGPSSIDVRPRDDSLSSDIDVSWKGPAEATRFHIRSPELGEVSVPGVARKHTFSTGRMGRRACFQVRSEVNGVMSSWLPATALCVAKPIGFLNQPPDALMYEPSNGSTVTGPRITLKSGASDPDGSVRKVEYFIGEAKIGESSVPPFEVTWSGAARGSHRVYAVATDFEGWSGRAGSSIFTVDTGPNQPPTVSITSPANNTVVTEPNRIVVQANSNDRDGRVVSVELLDGGRSLYKTSGATLHYTISNPMERWYRLSVVATDDLGATSVSSTVNVRFNRPPSVVITSPSSGAVIQLPGSLSISAIAADSGGLVGRVSFYANGRLLSTDYGAPFTYDWRDLQPGSYILTAQATDGDGVSATSAPVNVTVVGQEISDRAVALTVNWRPDINSVAIKGNGLDVACGNYTVERKTKSGYKLVRTLAAAAVSTTPAEASGSHEYTYRFVFSGCTQGGIRYLSSSLTDAKLPAYIN